MSRLYWRPAGASPRALALLALIALCSLGAVGAFQSHIQQDDFQMKLAAAERAHRAFELIRNARVRRGYPVDPGTDPAQTGLIGIAASPVTSSSGWLPAKQITANPNFAAVVVEYLKRLDVQKGDLVAIGQSGSFPALNVAVMAAAETLELEPLAITSTAASDWGANIPELMWPDMERLLYDNGVIRSRSLAASMGGVEDRGLAMTDEGRRLVLSAIERNGLSLLPSFSFEDAITKRMRLYDEAAEGRPIRAYINVGGGAVSVGRHQGKITYKSGVNLPVAKAPVDSVIGRFLDRGVPVIHLVRVHNIAEAQGLPLENFSMPEPGQGGVFTKTTPNRFLVVFCLLLMTGAIIFVGRRARARAHLKTVPPPVSKP